jgi:L-rhamnose mutarotase
VAGADEAGGSSGSARNAQVQALATSRLDRSALRKAGIANYSIYHFRGQLFAYYEYTGPEAEYEARMKDLAAAPRMREWWDIMEPMQVPLEGRKPGAWWAEMEEVFHID